MFLSGTAFYSARTLLKGRETDLLNLRGLAQVRAVGKQGRRSLCFHMGAESAYATASAWANHVPLGRSTWRRCP